MQHLFESTSVMASFDNFQSDAFADFDSSGLLCRECLEFVDGHVLNFLDFLHVFVELVFDFHEFWKSNQRISIFWNLFIFLLRPLPL